MLFSLVSSPAMKVATAAGAAAIAVCGAGLPATAMTVFDVSGSEDFFFVGAGENSKVRITGTFSGTITEDGDDSSANVLLSFNPDPFRDKTSTFTIPDVVFDILDGIDEMSPNTDFNFVTYLISSSEALELDGAKLDLFTNEPLSRGQDTTAFFRTSLSGRSPEDLQFNILQERVGSIAQTLQPEPAAIPTPALLPGLIGMGAAAFRKRKET
ncbi:MAG: PTPA-CTERM sorting domain-containing protein [Cyanobacteria bacterium J06623_5]